MLIITSEHPSSEDNFERKFQSNISTSNQIFEQPEEELIGFKGKEQNGTKQVLIITHWKLIAYYHF